MVLNVLIGDTFAINLGIDLIQPGLLYARYVAAPAATTQVMIAAADLLSSEVAMQSNIPASS
jgi:hypothetical protein